MRYWKMLLTSILLTFCTAVQGETIQEYSPMDIMVQLLEEQYRPNSSSEAVEPPVRATTPKVVVSHRPAIEAPHSATESELRCLMRNMYHEAYGEGDLGMVAVAYVTLNRVANRHYPGSICNVVYQPYQFSWTRDDRKRHASVPRVAYQRVRQLAEAVINQSRRNPIGQALYFNHVSLSPRHTRGRRSQVIGNHRFYH